MLKAIINFIMNLVIIWGLFYIAQYMGLEKGQVLIVIILQIVFCAKMIMEALNAKS